METQNEIDLFESDNYIFKKDYKDYKRYLDPVKEYIKQASFYVSKKFGISENEAIEVVKRNLKTHPIINPMVKYRFQTESGDRIVEEVKLTDYIKDAQEENEIIAPSFTTYYSKSKRKSIHAVFLEENVAKRKKHKHQMFKYKQLNDNMKAMYHNVMQKIMKILNNSVSGAYGSSSTVLNNPSAHYTLTSLTRSLASIGNASTEVLISGNRMFRNPSDVYGYITSICTNVNLGLVKLAIKEYNLYIPTYRDLMDVILYSTDRYWKDSGFEEEVYKIILKLNDEERSAVVYVNSLWDLKRFNDGFMRELLAKSSSKVTGVTDNKKWMEDAPEGIDILSKIICYDDIKGMDVIYDKIAGTELMSTLASTARNITMVFRSYSLLFNAFFKTNILPINVAYIKEILRDSIVLSDTDSTCASYDKWVEWYFGAVEYNNATIALSAVLMTINTQAMDHNIKVFCRNMNIDNKDVELLKMKNEFLWSIFTATNNTKHYFADTCVQEGNVYSSPEPEIKGVHLISSYANADIVKTIHNDIMGDINKKIPNGEKLNLLYYVKKVADLERQIEDRLKKGDLDIYKYEKIKDPKSYKKDRENSPYIYHILWEEIFSNKYGTAGEPTYYVIKIPTVLNTKTALSEFIESIKDEDIRNRFTLFCKRYNKTMLGTIKIPIHVLKTLDGIPEEILPAIDYKRITIDNLNAAYIVLETIGFYKKQNLLLKDQGY